MSITSHYCRKDTSLLYLEAGWTNRKLYNAYCSESTIQKPVSMKFFNRVVKSKNLSIFHPRKDQCDVCLGHTNGLVGEIEYSEHIIHKDCAREAKVRDKAACINDPKLVVVTMDLQAVLLCP